MNNILIYAKYFYSQVLRCISILSNTYISNFVRNVCLKNIPTFNEYFNN